VTHHDRAPYFRSDRVGEIAEQRPLPHLPDSVPFIQVLLTLRPLDATLFLIPTNIALGTYS
jgi:hypothetical protein